MGLDAVELVISYEEAFGLLIPGEVAETWRTPRDVIEWVYAQQAAGTSVACLKMRSFHRLRQGLEEGGWIERRELKLDTDLKERLKEANLQDVWRHLGRKHGLYPPELVRPSWLTATLHIITCCLSIWLGSVLTDNPKSAFFMFLVIWAILEGLAFIITQPFARCWPNKATTPRQLAEYFTMNHPDDLVAAGEKLTREQIAETVKSITCEYCSPKDYREDARFVQDLGLD